MRTWSRSSISRRRSGSSTGASIRNLEDAAAFVREHESRPGVDPRDEVLHALERAQGGEQAHAATRLFVGWLEELEAIE
jgi:hypothetical protein